MTFKVPEKFRVKLSGYPQGDATNGAFVAKLKHSQVVFVLASDGEGWEHVSVSRKDRCPIWEEMCQVKDLFWDDEDVVMQFHVPPKDHVNNHPYCLHMWKSKTIAFPRPPSILVGVPKIGS